MIKAGYDFKDIKWSEKGDKIEVTLPEVKVLSNEIDLDSFKVYHEELQMDCLRMREVMQRQFWQDFLEMSMIWINMRLSFRINKKEER